MKIPTSSTHHHALASKLVRHHEGVRSHPYCDSVGKITIGVGRNLTDRGLSVPEIETLFENDMVIATDILDIWCPQWRTYSVNRRAALLSMAFNLGGPRLTGFKKMRAALMDEDFVAAALQAMQSKWARQVGKRASEISEMIQKG